MWGSHISQGIRIFQVVGDVFCLWVFHNHITEKTGIGYKTHDSTLLLEGMFEMNGDNCVLKNYSELDV